MVLPAVEWVTTWDLQAWDLRGRAVTSSSLWPPSALFTFSLLKDQYGDPLSLPLTTPRLSLLPLSRLLCAPELSSCHFNRIKASE